MNKYLVVTVFLFAFSTSCFSQTVLITGANRGIGLALVKEYLNQDATVIATIRSMNTATELQQLKSDKLQIIVVDFLNEDCIEVIKSAVKDQSLDIIIHNAGFFPYGAHNAPDLSTKEWLDAFLIHTIRPTQISLALQKNMQKTKNPKVIAISSRRGSFTNNALDNYTGRYGYRSSKAGMNAAMQALALDFKEPGITVLILHPGRVATEMTKYDGIPTAESACLIAKVITNNDISNTGSFIDVTTGAQIAW